MGRSRNTPEAERGRGDGFPYRGVDPDEEGRGPVTDPELESDLGPELGLRGDKMLAEISALRAEVESAQAEITELREKAARAQADFENARKRVEREHGEAVKRAGERVVSALLPVIDNLERAIDHETLGGERGELLKGVELVRQQLLEVLAREGVTVIDPFGQPFDPFTHEAVVQRDDPEVPDHTVVEVLQKGYQIHGRVIRNAMVAVSTGGPPAPKE